MTLRNVPIPYTLDQQKQDINNLAGVVNDLDFNFHEKIDDIINGLITAGKGIAAVYDDTANTYTLALDFKLNDKLFNLLNDLDIIVKELGGKIYLAKDVRMDKELFLCTYPKLSEFKRTIRKYNPKNSFESIQSKRLNILRND